MFDIHKIYTNGVHVYIHVSCMTKITFIIYVLRVLPVYGCTHTGTLLNKYNFRLACSRVYYDVVHEQPQPPRTTVKDHTCSLAQHQHLIRLFES